MVESASRSRLALRLAAIAFASLVPLACGDDSAHEQDGGSGADAGAEGGPVGACQGLQLGASARGPGGCCSTDTDCDIGFCLGGFCTRPCAGDADCLPSGGPEDPTPFPAGTILRCVSEPEIGIPGYCWPGSAAACDGSPGSCPPGESCGVWFAVGGQIDGGVVQRGLAGRCLTSFATGPGGATGDRCLLEDPYMCQNPVGLYNNCIGGACTQGCDPAVTGSCPADTECFGPLTVTLRSTAIEYQGAGLCVGPSCGHLQFSDQPGDVRHVDAPGSCGPGRYCAAFEHKAGAPDTLWLVCATSEPGRVQAGGDCQQERILGLLCQDEQSCIETPPVPDSNGRPCTTSADCPDPSAPVCVAPDGSYAGSGSRGTCSAAPSNGFCSVLCRNDADCAQVALGDGTKAFGANPPPICLEVRSDSFPAGSAGRLPYCFAFDRAFATPGGPPRCSGEATCQTATTHTSCLPISSRSSQSFCGSAQDGNPSGASCTTPGANCGANSLCLRSRLDDALHCTNLSFTVAVGQACSNTSAGDNTCASATCWDRLAQSAVAQPATTRCSAVCRTGADCPAGMTCVPLRVEDNGTAAPEDDTILGYCLTQIPANPNDQCTSDADCSARIGHGDKCDLATHACYRSTALVGDACSADGDCGHGASCLQPPAFPAFVGGYCVIYGCDPQSRTGCPPEAACVPQGNGTGTCLLRCNSPADCRSPGYTCDTTTTPATCAPP
jgi:hypothetical protein